MHQVEEITKESDTKPKMIHLKRPEATYALCGHPPGRNLPRVGSMQEALGAGVSCPDCLLKAESIWSKGFDY